MPPTSVLLLREKKAGHVHQVEGVAKIIAARWTCCIERLDVKPAFWAHELLRAALIDRIRTRSQISAVAKAIYGVDFESLARPDVVIASGRPAKLLAILSRRFFAAKLVYAGFSAGAGTDEVDLVLDSHPRHWTPATQGFVPLPGLIDCADLRPARQLRHASDLLGLRVALMIGGNSHAHSYARRDWLDLERLVQQTKQHFGIRWHVSTSRRSAAHLSPMIGRWLSNGMIDEFVDYGAEGAGSGNHLFNCDALVVTEDSLSMLSEACAARRPVIALSPRKVRLHRDLEVVSFYAGQGWLTCLPLAYASAEAFEHHVLRARVPVWSVPDLISAHLETLLGKASALHGRDNDDCLREREVVGDREVDLSRVALRG